MQARKGGGIAPLLGVQLDSDDLDPSADPQVQDSLCIYRLLGLFCSTVSNTSSFSYDSPAGLLPNFNGQLGARHLRFRALHLWHVVQCKACNLQ